MQHKLKYCDRCLTTNLRPNAEFIDETCVACVSHSPSLRVNYFQRFKKLEKFIAQQYSLLSNDFKTRQHQCVVGVSGGKDSTRQALWVRDRLKMNPLIVVSAYTPKQMTDIGAKNLENLIKLGFDIHVVNPAPRTAQELTRQSFFQYGNTNKSSEKSLFSIVPQIAISKGIPFIFWGENPATQVGDGKVMGENEFDGNNLRDLNTLVEGGDKWIEEIAGYSKASLYKYPTTAEFSEVGLKIIYLGPVWDDWSFDTNAAMASLGGLTLRPHDTHLTGDVTGASMLDEEFTNINMMIKYYKFGFGRATDYCNELIRQNRLSRTDAIKLVETYDGVCGDEIIDRFCKYIDVTEEEFWECVHRYTNTDLFSLTSKQRPTKKFIVGENIL